MPRGGGRDARRSLMSPFTMRVPTLVTKPLRLSDRYEDKARVEPFSDGASRAATSSSPAFRDCNVSCRAARSHWSSLACRRGEPSHVANGQLVKKYQRCRLFLYQIMVGDWRPDRGRHLVTFLFSSEFATWSLRLRDSDLGKVAMMKPPGSEKMRQAAGDARLQCKCRCG
jgi:hypothetical protein